MTHKSFEEERRMTFGLGYYVAPYVRCEYHKILSVIILTGDLSVTTKQSGWNNPRQTPEVKIAHLESNASFALGEIRDSI